MALDILNAGSSVRLGGATSNTETLEEKIRKAKALGYSDAEIAKAMGTEGAQAPVAQPKPKDTSLQRTLLTTGGSILGGIGGGLVGGPVGLIAGGALGASAGEGAYQALTPEDDTDLGKIAKEGAMSGALDVATLGLFKAAKTAPALLKLLKGGGKVAEGVAEAGIETAVKGAGKEASENLIQKLGKKVTEYGEDYSVKGFGKPGGAAKLEKRYGKFSELLNKYPELTRGDTDEYGAIVGGVQKSFDDIALKSGAKIDKNSLRSAVIENANKLYNDGTTKGIQMAEKMIDEFGIIEKKLPDSIDISDLTAQRRVYDDYVKTFQAGDADKGLYQHLRDAFQESIYKGAEGKTAGGKDLKQLGQELNKLYGYQDYFESASKLGKTGKPLGLTTLLSTGAGGALGGIPGAVAAAGAERAINSPKGVKLMSDLIKKAGAKTTQMGAKIGAETAEAGVKGAGELTRKNIGAAALLGGGANLMRSGATPDPVGMKEELPGMEGMPPVAQPQYVDRGEYVTDPATNEHFSKDLTKKFNKQTQQWEDNVGGSSQGLSRESLVQQMVQDLQTTGGKNIAKLETIMKALEKIQGGGGQTMSDTKAKELVTAETAIKQLDSLEQGFATSSEEITGAGPLLGKAFSSLPFATSASGLDAQARLAAQTIGVALEGGKLTDADILRYQQHIIPNAGDSKKKAQQKIDNLRMLLNTRLEELKKTRSVSDYSKGAE